MSPEFKMIWITTMILIVAINLVKYGLKGHDAWHEYKYGNEDMALNAISGHACFESDRNIHSNLVIGLHWMSSIVVTTVA